MTLPASGALSGQNIRDELRQSGGNIVVPDPTTRWLANKPSGSIIWPNDFHGKQAIRLVYSGLAGVASTTYSTTVSLGTAFPNRRFVICVAVLGSAVVSQILVTSAFLGGVALTQGPGQAWFNPSVNTTMGIFTGSSGGISGTSSTFGINFNQSASVLRIAIYSISNIGTILSTNQNGSASSTGTSTTVTIGSNGVAVACCLKSNCPAGNLVLTTGLSIEDTDVDLGSNVRFATGFENRLLPEAPRAYAMSGTGSNGIVGIAAASFN